MTKYAPDSDTDNVNYLDVVDFFTMLEAARQARLEMEEEEEEE